VKGTSRRSRRRTSEEEIEEEVGEGIKAPPRVSALAKPEEAEPTIDTALQQELSDAITQLVFTSQDLSFELAMLECDRHKECKLVKRSRELVKEVRKLFDIQKRMTRRGIPRQVRQVRTTYA